MGVSRTLGWCKSQVGIRETDVNHVRYWEEIGLGGLNGAEWCGAFAFDALMRGGADLTWTTARRFVWTPAGIADASKAGIFHRSGAEPGDIVWYDWGGDGTPDHVGIVRTVLDSGVVAYEGNYRDHVAIVRRPHGSIMGYARPGYGESIMAQSAAHVPVTIPGVPAPEYPLPDGWYFGPRSPLSRVESVSGYFGHRSDLRRWQRRMRRRGWDISADGLYGPQTAHVATQFQAEKGLEVDGLIGPQTWAAAWKAAITP